MADKIAFFYSRASQSDGTAEDALEDKSIGNKNNCKLIPSQKKLNSIPSNKDASDRILQLRKEEIVAKIMKLKL